MLYIELKTVQETPNQPTIVEFYERSNQTRQIYKFTVYKQKQIKHLSHLQIVTVGLDDGYYHEGEREDCDLKLMAKLEAKALQQKVKEKTILIVGVSKITTTYY